MGYSNNKGNKISDTSSKSDAKLSLIKVSPKTLEKERNGAYQYLIP